MKLGEVRQVLVKAFVEGDAKTAGPIVDRLRTRGWRTAQFAVQAFTYNDLLAFAQEAKPDIERATWDAFLSAIDDLDSAEETR